MIRSAHFERDIVEAAGGRLLTFPAQDAPGSSSSNSQRFFMQPTVQATWCKISR